MRTNSGRIISSSTLPIQRTVGRRPTIGSAIKGMRFQSLLSKILVLALLSAGAVMVLMPLVWMLSTSLKSKSMSTEFPPRWIPMDAKRVEIEGKECFIYAIPVDGETRELALLQKEGPVGIFVNPDNLDERYELEVQAGERVYEVRLHWENYARAMTARPFDRYAVNSLMFVGFSVTVVQSDGIR